MKNTYLSLDLSYAKLDEQLFEIKKYQSRISQIHEAVVNKTVEEKNWLGWFNLPSEYDKDEFARMKEKANSWKEDGVEVVVVIGIGGSYLGAKTGYDFIYGEYSIKKPAMELLFAGNDISAESLVSKLQYVKDKKFAINVISKSGTTLEPSIAFREFRNLLEKKEKENASKYIVATTDKQKGVLFELATLKNYTKFVIPDDVGGRFSVLTPVGIFPFLCAGIDAEKVLEGASITNAELMNDDIMQNSAYAYAATRYYLYKERKYTIEMMVSYEPKIKYFAEWWKQLFAESEGKDGKGIWPTSGVFSTDLHSIGQMVQEGNKILFETVLTVKNVPNDIMFDEYLIDFDKLNYLANKRQSEVNNAAYKATVNAHAIDGNVPNILLQFKDFTEYTLGALFMFFERALTMSAYLLGVNPFNQPGVEIYKKNMFTLLGKK